MIKKILLAGVIISGLIGVQVSAELRYSAGVGIIALKDEYNKKVFVLEVIPDSSAALSGIPAGAEILKINNESVRRLSCEEINSLLNGDTSADLEIMVRYNKKKTEYNLVRANYKSSDEVDEKFLLYWNQIAPKDLYLKKIPAEVLEKLSTDYQEDILASQGYWIKQKSNFQNGYDACLTYPDDEQNTCLLNLVNTINNNISRNKQLDIHGDSVPKQKDGIPIYNVNQIMLQNAFQNLGDRY